jgi:hypothetical protein
MTQKILVSPNMPSSTNASYNHFTRLFEVEPGQKGERTLQKALILVHEVAHAITPYPEIGLIGKGAWIQNRIENEALAEAFSYMAFVEYLKESGKLQKVAGDTIIDPDTTATFKYFVDYAKDHPLSRSSNDPELFRRAYDAGLEWTYRVNGGYYENFYGEQADELCKTRGC